MKSILKSIFISLLPIASLYFTIEALYKFINTGFSYLFIGSLLVSAPLLFFFLWLFIKPVARTDANLKIHTVIITIGFILSILTIGILKHHHLSEVFHIIGLFLGWALYLRWYSIFNNRKNTTAIKIGNQLPDLELENSEKNKILTSSFIGSPTIFLFYRGNWCPLCMAQIKEIASQYQELEKRGAHVVLISPQPHKYTESLAKNFDVNFSFLVDPDHSVAKKLAIFDKNGLPMGLQVFGYDSDTVLPTVIITNKTGRIIYANLTDNYRVRPEPETFIKILDQKIGSV